MKREKLRTKKKIVSQAISEDGSRSDEHFLNEIGHHIRSNISKVADHESIVANCGFFFFKTAVSFLLLPHRPLLIEELLLKNQKIARFKTKKYKNLTFPGE